MARPSKCLLLLLSLSLVTSAGSLTLPSLASAGLLDCFLAPVESIGVNAPTADLSRSNIGFRRPSKWFDDLRDSLAKAAERNPGRAPTFQELTAFRSAAFASESRR